MATSRKKHRRLLSRPEGCLSPNAAGKKLGCTGEAVKQWIYSGKLKAAKDPANGYWWIREQDLDEYLQGRHAALVFKFHHLK